VAYAQSSSNGTFAHWLGTISAFLTAFYSFRLLYLAFIGTTNSYRESFFHVHEGPLRMSIPLGILAIGSIFVGYWGKDAFVGLGTTFWNNAIVTYPSRITILESEFIPTNIKLVPVIFSVIGATLAVIFYHFFPHLLFHIKTSRLGRPLYFFLSNKWYWDWLYNQTIAKPFLNFGHIVSYKVLDRGLFEALGPSGLSQGVQYLARSFSLLQSGYIYHYAFVLFSSTTLSLILLTWGVHPLIDYQLAYLLPLIGLYYLCVIHREN
jgi:NADH:ubiquinone oxidoreductase subunit 5 (subunit L)/multisubunit Na+/H+ antiporter MnhA subunit